MTAAHEHAMFRTVILQPLPADDAASAGDRHQAFRLLSDMGHDVVSAGSSGEAMELLNSRQTDLMVVDASGLCDSAELARHLSDLPADRRPRQVAIFSDRADESLRALRRRVSPQSVHVFLKPLHMHGLLSVVRHLESETPVGATA